MSNSRNIADSAPVINFIDGVTSNVQTQLNTLTTAVGNVSVTNGSLTKTFAAGETADITLSSGVLVPNVSVTKEISQTGVTNNDWDASAGSYTLENSAPSTSLSFVAGNVSTATYSNKTFDLSNESINTYGLAFNSDGSKMFVTFDGDDTVKEYNLSTSGDIATSVFSKSFNLISGTTFGCEFNPDGTKFFFITNSNQTIQEYSLSTAFDISTLSATRSFSVSSQASNPLNVCFNTDGTKMYVANFPNTIKTYTLSTGFNISTASYSSSYTVSQDSQVYDIQFKNNGTKMYIVGNQNDSIYEYSLSTAFDVSSAGSPSVFAVSGQSTAPASVAFVGDNIYLLASSADVFQYNIPYTSLALGSGSFAAGDVSKTILVNNGQFLLTATSGTFSQVTAPTSYATASSGSWALNSVFYDATSDALKLGQIGTGYVIGSSVYTSKSFNITDGVGNICISTDGLHMYIAKYSGNTIDQYALSVAFDVSSASFVRNSGTITSASGLYGVAISPDGTKLFTCGYSSVSITCWALSTAFDVSSKSIQHEFNASTNTPTPSGLGFSEDGLKLYACSYNHNKITSYTLQAAFSMTGDLTFISEFSTASQGRPRSVKFNRDGTEMYVCIGSVDALYKYNLTTGFDLTTASVASGGNLSQYFDLASQDNSPNGVAFSPDGTQFIMLGETTDKVYGYTMANFTSPTGYQPCISGNIDTTYWTDLNSTTATNAIGSGGVFYAVSTDNKTTWKVQDATGAARSIVKNNSGTYQYNSNATFGSETWTNATTNTEVSALRESMAVAVNKMTSTTLNALSDANQIALGNDLDFAAILYIASGSTVPTYSGTALNYDANVLNQGVVLGTDYNWDAPATNKVRITTVGAGNFKVRVV